MFEISLIFPPAGQRATRRVRRSADAVSKPRDMARLSTLPVLSRFDDAIGRLVDGPSPSKALSA